MKLIDADKIGLTDFEIIMCQGDYREAFKMLLDKINNQATVYDIDNVIEELEELKNRYDKNDFAIRGIIEKAIEIVKYGCVSYNVCEWNLEDEEANLYLTGCQQRQLLFDGTPKENGYKYCPYCGKKILCKE